MMSCWWIAAAVAADGMKMRELPFVWEMERLVVAAGLRGTLEWMLPLMRMAAAAAESEA